MLVHCMLPLLAITAQYLEFVQEYKTITLDSNENHTTVTVTIIFHIPKPPNYMVLEKEGPTDGERGTSDSKNPKHQAPTHLRARLTLTKSSGRTLQSKPGCNTSPGKLFAYSQTVAWVKKELARTTIRPDDWTDQRAPRKGF